MPPITRQLETRTGGSFNHIVCWFESPLTYLDQICPAVSEIYQFESECIDQIFGPSPIVWHRGRVYFKPPPELLERPRPHQGAGEIGLMSPPPIDAKVLLPSGEHGAE